MNNEMLNNFTKEELFEEIERLRGTLAWIACDYYELSHEKIKYQRDEFRMVADKSHSESINWECDKIFKGVKML
jgi:hypothetical protein